MAAFADVVTRVTAVRASESSALISGIGRGVVVTTWRGASPKRKPNCSMSQVSCGRRHLPSSSAQAAVNCGPRKLSGSSAENRCATAPQGQVTCRFDGSNRGRAPGGCTARRPETPSTMTVRASASVSPISAIRASGSARAWARTHSAPARVFPAPRPPSINQVVQDAPSSDDAGGS